MTNSKTSTRELLKLTFEAIVALKNKEIAVDDAKAQAWLIKQANNLYRYELDRAIALKKFEELEIRNIES